MKQPSRRIERLARARRGGAREGRGAGLVEPTSVRERDFGVLLEKVGGGEHAQGLRPVIVLGPVRVAREQVGVLSVQPEAEGAHVTHVAERGRRGDDVDVGELSSLDRLARARDDVGFVGGVEIDGLAEMRARRDVRVDDREGARGRAS